MPKTLLIAALAILIFLTLLRVPHWVAQIALHHTPISNDGLLAYAAALIISTATLFLGYVAYKQNREANAINKRMQEIEKAAYVSIVSVRVDSVLEITSDERSLLMESGKKIIDFSSDSANPEHYFMINVSLENRSEYPVVRMEVITDPPDSNDSGPEKYYLLKPSVGRMVYLEKLEEEAYDNHGYTFLVPSDVFKKRDAGMMTFKMRFTNMFSFETRAVLNIFGLLEDNWNVTKRFRYRIVPVRQVDEGEWEYEQDEG